MLILQDAAVSLVLSAFSVQTLVSQGIHCQEELLASMLQWLKKNKWWEKPKDFSCAGQRAEHILYSTDWKNLEIHK